MPGGDREGAWVLGRIAVVGAYAVAVFFAGIWVGARYLTCAEPTYEANQKPGITALAVLGAVGLLPWIALGVRRREAWYFVAGGVVTLPTLYWIVQGLDLEKWRLSFCF